MMLKQRETWSELRPALISKALTRFHSLRRGTAINGPYIWVSVAPEFVMGEVSTIQSCGKSVEGLGYIMRVDGGAIGFQRGRDRPDVNIQRMRSVTTLGDTLDVSTQIASPVQAACLISVEKVATYLRRSIIAARNYFRDTGNSFSGPVRVTVAIEQAHGSFGDQRGEGTCDHAVIDSRLEATGETDSYEIGLLELNSPMLPVEYLIMKRLGVALGFEEMEPEAFDSW
ncbi:hypothetical protein [Botrimarina mediterranea]|uniref:hypothetical protein n=1 Tax=Botrimarina mediterranea TaxID=2528022 RepID=UPI003AF31EC6